MIGFSPLLSRLICEIDKERATPDGSDYKSFWIFNIPTRGWKLYLLIGAMLLSGLAGYLNGAGWLSFQIFLAQRLQQEVRSS